MKPFVAVIRTVLAAIALASVAPSAHSENYDSVHKQYGNIKPGAVKLPPSLSAVTPGDFQVRFVWGDLEKMTSTSLIKKDGDGFIEESIIFFCQSIEGPLETCSAEFDRIGLGLIDATVRKGLVESTVMRTDSNFALSDIQFTPSVVDSIHNIDVSSSEEGASDGYDKIQDHGVSAVAHLVKKNCTYKSITAAQVSRKCSVNDKSYVGWGFRKGQQSSYNSDAVFYWNDKANAYLSWDGTTSKFVDLKYGNGPWQSQIDAQNLTADQKSKARDLFAKGFDLMKASDFTGAKIYITEGLKIDRSNYLGWSTLGDINKAEYLIDNDKAEFIQSMFDYRRVIDLAPVDSIEYKVAVAHLEKIGFAPKCFDPSLRIKSLAELDANDRTSCQEK